MLRILMAAGWKLDLDLGSREWIGSRVGGKNPDNFADLLRNGVLLEVMMVNVPT